MLLQTTVLIKDYDAPLDTFRSRSSPFCTIDTPQKISKNNVRTHVEFRGVIVSSQEGPRCDSFHQTHTQLEQRFYFKTQTSLARTSMSRQVTKLCCTTGVYVSNRAMPKLAIGSNQWRNLWRPSISTVSHVRIYFTGS